MSNADTTPPVPSPMANPETARFWAVLGRGEFFVPRCGACGKAHWYPRAFCPFCFSEDVAIEPSTGEATVYSYSVMNTKPPLILAYVELAEGPKALTNLVDVDPSSVHVGMKVKPAWRLTEDGTQMPFFTAA